MTEPTREQMVALLTEEARLSRCNQRDGCTCDGCASELQRALMLEAIRALIQSSQPALDTLTRYHWASGFSGGPHMFASKQGEWVRFSDLKPVPPDDAPKEHP